MIQSPPGKVPPADNEGRTIRFWNPSTGGGIRELNGHVGSIHAFYNRTEERVRWLETQSPQPPANYSYRFNRDWDYLAEQLSASGADEGAR